MLCLRISSNSYWNAGDESFCLLVVGLSLSPSGFCPVCGNRGTDFSVLDRTGAARPLHTAPLVCSFVENVPPAAAKISSLSHFSAVMMLGPAAFLSCFLCLHFVEFLDLSVALLFSSGMHKFEPLFFPECFCLLSCCLGTAVPACWQRCWVLCGVGPHGGSSSGMSSIHLCTSSVGHFVSSCLHCVATWNVVKITSLTSLSAGPDSWAA